MKKVLVSGIKMPPEHNWDDLVKSATKILKGCNLSGKTLKFIKNPWMQGVKMTFTMFIR